jgi:hypothetical protein
MTHRFIETRDRLVAESNVADSSRARPTNAEKWWFAFLLGLLFAIISSNVAYGLTNLGSSVLCLPATIAGCGPTLYGLIVHTIIFIIVVRLVLW